MPILKKWQRIFKLAKHCLTSRRKTTHEQQLLEPNKTFDDNLSLCLKNASQAFSILTGFGICRCRFRHCSQFLSLHLILCPKSANPKYSTHLGTEPSRPNLPNYIYILSLNVGINSCHVGSCHSASRCRSWNQQFHFHHLHDDGNSRPSLSMI